MEIRYTPDNESYKKFTSSELRKYFLLENLFTPDKIELVYTDVDRSIIGSAVPASNTLKLTASKKEMASDYFAQRREIGVINIGGTGSVKLDNESLNLEHKDALYIGRGVKEIGFSSNNAKEPAKFYFVSYPAHTAYPSKLIKLKDAVSVSLGSDENSNKRTIHKYILPDILTTCQIVMGLTTLEKGSVWNTLPPHNHQRRTEIYMYFNLPEESAVFHLMGEAEETRHILVHNQQSVISPAYSIHSGVGTQNYSFIWAMGGENQDFDDMDWIKISELR